MKNSILMLALLLAGTYIIKGQDEIKLEDYNRAVRFMYDNYNKKAFNLFVQPNWLPDSTGVWYIDRSANDKKYVLISFPGLAKSDLFDHQRLASLLSDSLAHEINVNDLPISALKYISPSELKITVENKEFTLNTESYTITLKHETEKSNEFEQMSPDSKWVAYAQDYNLYVQSTESEEVKQLSKNGKKGYEYATWFGWADVIEGENGERPKHFGVRWSADSEWILANLCDMTTAQKMYLLDWSIDTLYRPRLLSYYRGSPGDTGMIYETPVFFNMNSGKQISPPLPRSTHINAISSRWSVTSEIVYLESQSRGYQSISLYSFNLKNESLQTLYTETSDTNIDNFDYELVEEKDLLLFLSEKSGWRQLYSLDLKTKIEKPLTEGEYYINSIERIDYEKETIYFLASGKEYGRNPYYQHLYSISFTGDDLKIITPEDAHHVISISPDGQFVFDNYSTGCIPTKTILRNALSGEKVMDVTAADLSFLTGWSPPEIFTAIARDGITTIYGALWKPSNFDPSKSYPVLEYSYTGPHTHVFPKEFSRSIGFQSYAELGFIVVVVDGLGSSGRSKAFHNYSYKNLGGNLADHVLAIKQLGSRFSWIDTTRVGIFGHSAGGYDAGHALLAYPDFYKVAVASSADHDHRMEKAWWPEMYMGWPVDSAYHLQSNITMAGNLKGKLLITHGGIDENVNPSATFKLAEALIKADKQFDMLILPSQRHGYQGVHQKYFTKTRWNYFIKHLRGVEPIWDFDWE